MGSGHVLERHRLTIFIGESSAIASIVSEAVLNSDDNPVSTVQLETGPARGPRASIQTYQRLVKTTPKPRATKKSNGELLLLPPLSGLLLLSFCPVGVDVCGVEADDLDWVTVGAGVVEDVASAAARMAMPVTAPKTWRTAIVL